MKSIVRLIVLLVVCILVGVGVYAAVQTNPQWFGYTAGSGFEGRGERPGLDGGTTPGETMERPAFGERPEGAGFERGAGDGGAGDGARGGGEHGAAGGAQAWLGVARNLGLIGLITLGVWLVQKAFALVQRLFRRRVHSPAAG